MSTTESSARFQRLNNTNYAEWSLRMEAILVRAGLWGMIHPEVTHTKEDGTDKDASTITLELEATLKACTVTKMNEARAEIILHLEDGQLSHCLRSNDPHVVWLVLESVHRAAGFVTSLALRRKFLTLKKTSSETMQAWIGQIQALGFRLEQAGISVSDQDKILALTMGLPSSYDAIIINFDSTPSDQLTLSHVISRLLNEEVRQTSGQPSNINDTSEETRDEAMAVTGCGGRRAGGGTPSDVVCIFCDKKGHYKSDCPDRLAWESSKKKGSKEYAAAVFNEDEQDFDEDGVGYF
jgi:hypothetical protein